jgi:hypothetical protein
MASTGGMGASLCFLGKTCPRRPLPANQRWSHAQEALQLYHICCEVTWHLCSTRRRLTRCAGTVDLGCSGPYHCRISLLVLPEPGQDLCHAWFLKRTTGHLIRRIHTVCLMQCRVSRLLYGLDRSRNGLFLLRLNDSLQRHPLCYFTLCI